MTFKPSQPKLCYDYKGPSNAMVPREAPTHIPMGGQATRGPGWGSSTAGAILGLGQGREHMPGKASPLFKLCPVLAKIPIVTYSSGLTGDINI